MKNYFSIIALLFCCNLLIAQTLITPADVTNFQTAATNANANEVYQETTNKIYYIGLSNGRLKLIQDSIKTNATLTGFGFSGSLLGIAQQGATTNQVLK
jgi:hypothetical protein